MKLIFLPADKYKRFLQDDSITLRVRSLARPRYSNKKFAISLQYLKENVKDEGDFLPADKRQRFLQIDITTLAVCCQACPKYSK